MMDSFPPAPSRASLIWNALFGLLLGGGAIALVLSRTDEREVGRRLAEADLGLALLAVVATLVGILSRGLRWHGLLSTVSSITRDRALAAYAVGNTTNMLAPARVGDLVRSRMAARRAGRTAAILASVAIERLLDLAILTVLFWCASLSLKDDRYRTIGIVLSLSVTLLFLLGGWVVMRARRRSSSGSRGRSGVVRFVAEHGGQFARGLDSVATDPGLVRAGLISSVFAWGASLLSVWAALGAAGVHVPLAGVILVEALFELAGALPSAPAFIGTLQAAAIAALTPFGISVETAVLFSVIYQASFVTGSVVAGVAGIIATTTAGARASTT